MSSRELRAAISLALAGSATRRRRISGLLAWLKEIGVPMNDPPRCVLAAEYVRYTQRCLADIGTVIESSTAAFNVNRICTVLVYALSEILLVKPAL